MLNRLTGKDAVSARQLSLETGLRQQTLSRWLQEASSLSVMPAKRPMRTWSIDEKIRILAKGSKLTGFSQMPLGNSVSHDLEIECARDRPRLQHAGPRFRGLAQGAEATERPRSSVRLRRMRA